MTLPTHRKDVMKDEPIFNQVLVETSIPYNEIVTRPKWNQAEVEKRLQAEAKKNSKAVKAAKR